MPNQIKVTFSDQVYFEELVRHEKFILKFGYLNPREEGLNVYFVDNVEGHSNIDSEVVILTHIAGFLNHYGQNTPKGDYTFLNPIVNEQKGGLVVGNTRIINSTEI